MLSPGVGQQGGRTEQPHMMQLLSGPSTEYRRAVFCVNTHTETHTDTHTRRDLSNWNRLPLTNAHSHPLELPLLLVTVVEFSYVTVALGERGAGGLRLTGSEQRAAHSRGQQRG